MCGSGFDPKFGEHGDHFGGSRLSDAGRGSPGGEKLVQSQDSREPPYRPAGCPQGERPATVHRLLAGGEQHPPIPDASMNVTADMSTSRCAGPGPVARASRHGPAGGDVDLARDGDSNYGRPGWPVTGGASRTCPARWWRGPDPLGGDSTMLLGARGQ